ncbi:MAG: flagellar protein G [Candidatus Methanoperedens sp.]|nr:flagellar protein G [Candidatus Methanoperedens sp.]
MGAGTSATQMIFFITSVIIALGVVGALFLNVQSISSAATMGSKTFSGQLRTDITIINDPEEIPHADANNYTFYVKNTGKEDLSTRYITVLIDGSLVPDSNLNKTILNGDAMWIPGDVLEINATASIVTGSHSLRVITENGVEDSFEFRE